MKETGALARIQRQIQWNRLIAVVEEQAQTMIRTAFSTTVRIQDRLPRAVRSSRHHRMCRIAQQRHAPNVQRGSGSWSTIVEFAGQPLAIVVGITRDAALAGAAALRPEIAPLPPVLSIEDAIAREAWVLPPQCAAGFKTAFLSGSCVAASRLGGPDLDLISFGARPKAAAPRQGSPVPRPGPVRPLPVILLGE